MIWVAWRQFRTQALVTLGLLLAFTAFALATGLNLHHDYSLLGGAHCQRRGDCWELVGVDRPVADMLWPALLAIPVLLGMFWGAPLVGRELESGTHRLAWTQSVSRRRWLSIRVAVVGVAALTVAGLASWLVSWWYAPLDAVNQNRFDPSVFGQRGILAIGYAGFAFALGVAAGALARRTLPAMAATLVGFGGARIAFTLWVRPHLLPTKQILTSITDGKGVGFVGSRWGVSLAAGAPPLPNRWLISSTLVDRSGHAPSIAQLHSLLARVCPAITNPSGGGKGAGKGLTGAGASCQNALGHSLRDLVVYQPGSHYWPLQALETGIFLAAGLALIAAAVWGIGPRRGATAPPVTGPPEPDPPVTDAPVTDAPVTDAPVTDPPERTVEPVAMRGRTPILRALVAAAVISLLAAGCGSSSPSSTSGSNSTTASSASTGSHSGPPTAAELQSLDRFATCLRAHGVNVPDPATDPGGFKGAFRVQTPALASAGQACQRFAPGGPGSHPDVHTQAQIAAMVAFAGCMRAHGFPGFPDPTSAGNLTHQMLAEAGISLGQPAVVEVADGCTGVTHGYITRLMVARFVAGQ